MKNEIAIPEEKTVAVAKPKKKASNVFRILIAFILLVVLIAVLWIGISWIQKVPSRTAIPSDYSVFLHTDSAYKTFDPLLDLSVTEKFLSASEFSAVGSAVRELKKSGLREKKSFKKIASRKTDLAFYSDKDGFLNVLAVVDMGPYSFMSRLAPVFLRHSIKGIFSDVKYIKGSGFSYFQVRDGGSSFYFAVHKNLIVASDDMNLLGRAMEFSSPESYSEQEDEAFSFGDGSLNLLIKPKVLLRSLADSNIISKEINNLLSEVLPASISLDLEQSHIRVDMSIPVDLSRAKSPLASLVTGESTVASFGSNVSGDVSSYTLMNFASLAELKDAIFPLFPKELKVNEIWTSAQYMCKMVLGITLDDLLFSWGGKEIAVIGIKDVEKPVFALEVKDERQRQIVFKKLSLSPLVKSDSFTLQDGFKLEQMKLPSFVTKLLSLFKISLPSSYYYVKDGFIYISESQAALSRLFNPVKADSLLDNNVLWDQLASDSIPSSISVYYNLNDKTPFFLQGDSAFTRALSLYSTGVCDISFDSDTMNVSLRAFSDNAGTLPSATGFPIQTKGVLRNKLLVEKKSRPQKIFWVEDGREVHSLDVKKMKQQIVTLELKEDEQLDIAIAEDSKKDSILWCVTSLGSVYLFDEKLKTQKGFPIQLDSPVSSEIAVMDQSVLFCLKDGNFVTVEKDSSVQKILLPIRGEISSKPDVLGNTVALYDKFYSGSIYLIQDGKCINMENPVSVQGNGTGSPALVDIGGKLAVSLITRNGQLESWWASDGRPLPAFPINLGEEFHAGIKTDGKNLYVLSDGARVYKVSYSGTIDYKVIPKSSATEGVLSLLQEDDDIKIFALVDGSKVFAFDSDLNLLPKYPISASSIPVFMDVNKDKADELLVVSEDAGINAWRLNE